MKIYVSHASDFDYKKELYEPLLSGFPNVEFVLPHKTNAFFNSKEAIKSADIVLAEVSFPSTGQGIELGWASDMNKKIVCFYKKGSKISNSLEVVTGEIVEYEDKEAFIEKLKGFINV